jgi:DNA-directed RNA polymerase subunit RPC12/RpoP
MTRTLPETPNLRWFKSVKYDCRMCGKRAAGELMGVTNESYGLHCKACADKRLKLSEKVRNDLVAERSA